VKVAVVQHDICWERRDATLPRVAPMVAAAADGGAELVVLPELFAVGFTMEPDRVAEAPDGPTTEWLITQASMHGMWLCGSVPIRQADGDRPANTFVLAGPAGQLHRYAKRHPFAFAGEDRHYAKGDDAPTIDVDGLRVSPSICYDLRFADQFWAQAPDTDCYVVVANWPASRRDHWRTLLRARAIENQAYVVGSNRTGASGDGLDHVGDSLVVDPMGEILADAGAVEGIVTAEVDPAEVRRARSSLPFLRDRR
jgi:predicted amidohydrolase